MSTNPYAAPKAAVADESLVSDADFNPAGRAVSTGRGWSWIAEAWALFRRQFWLWIGIALVLSIIMFAVALIPFLGPILQMLFYPVFIAGVIIGCASLHRGQRLEFGHLFAGFQNRTGTLIAVGALTLLGTIIILVVVGLIWGMQFFAIASWTPDMPLAMLALPILVFFALLLPVVMAFWFAPAVVALHELDAIASMKASFLGCLKNVLPFLVYGLVMLVLMAIFGVLSAAIIGASVLGGARTGDPWTSMLGAIALMFLLGLVYTVIFFPLVLASIYTAYRDIYLKPR